MLVVFLRSICLATNSLVGEYVITTKTVKGVLVMNDATVKADFLTIHDITSPFLSTDCFLKTINSSI